MNDKLSQSCPRCGTEMEPGSAGGVCPQCAAKFLQGTPTEPSASGRGKHAFTPPGVAELAAKFPQLELLAFVGQGGMGAVYKARQRQLDRVVALKILPPDTGEGPAFAERFAREAKALATLNHPGIVTIHDFGRVDGLFYFLMEFVDGVSLGQLMRGNRVSPREALAIVPQICDALQYAHDQGLVHWDIKPENILLDRRGRVKVADFGLVKLMEGGEEAASGGVTAAPGLSNLTEAGKLMGTPHYMAPEQVRHPAEVDHRADIYALGVVFYQMLTGKLPSKPFEAPSKNVRVDVRLDDVVLRALEDEPERRYQQASQVKTAVETIIQGSGPMAPQRNPAAVGQPSSSTAAKRQPIHPLSRLRLLATLACMGAVLVGIAVWKQQKTLESEQKAPQARNELRGQRSIGAVLSGQKVGPELARIAEDPAPKTGGSGHGEKLVLFPSSAEGEHRHAGNPRKSPPEWVDLKPLTGWISDLRNPAPEVRELAEHAITEMGTNALPEFLKILSDSEPGTEADVRRYNAAAALKVIGPGVRAAIPDFVRLMFSGNQEMAYAGARALAFTAPMVPEAFGRLTNALVDASTGIRDAANLGIGLILGSEANSIAEPALPTLLHNLSDGTQFVRADTAATLMLYVQYQRTHGRAAKPELIIPPIIRLLQDDYSYARH